MPLMPYLHFQGQCAAALGFYAEVFDGTGLQLMRYAEAPGASDAWSDSPLVMHGQVTLGDGVLMASDFPPGVAGEPQAGFSVLQSPPDVATAQRIFDQFDAGGTVIAAFEQTFVSPDFGMVNDRFGTHWIKSTMPAA